MSERHNYTNKNTIEMIDLLLDVTKYIDYVDRINSKEVMTSFRVIKKLKSKLKKHEIDINDWSDID